MSFVKYFLSYFEYKESNEKYGVFGFTLEISRKGFYFKTPVFLLSLAVTCSIGPRVFLDSNM